MKDGFIKLALASPEVRVGDVRFNAEQIDRAITEADAKNAGILVLPELSLTGATCGDLFMSDTLVNGAKDALFELVKRTEGLGFPVVVGLPVALFGRLYNAGAVISDGAVVGIVPCTKASGVFSAWTEANTVVELNGVSVPCGRLVFCAREMPDFTFGVEVGADATGAIPASAYLATAGANLVCSIGARAATVGSAAQNVEVLSVRSHEQKGAIAFVGAGPTESVTDALYSGERAVCVLGEVVEKSALTTGMTTCDVDLGAVAYKRRGEAVVREGFTRVELSVRIKDVELTSEVNSSPFVAACDRQARQNAVEVLSIQSKALARRMAHIGAKSLVIGMSGGLDSTIALLVCAKAVDELGLPRSAVKAISMPGFGTSSKTRGNAEIISERLGTDFKEISIVSAVRQHFADIGHDESVRDVTYENSQARERTQILMDVANKTGGIVVGTGDLSEVALGFATYNGDHMSMYGVNGSVPKTLIRSVITEHARCLDDEVLAKALIDVVATPVSPELLPTKDGAIAQITEDIVGPYELHDFFLYHMIERGAGARKIMRLATKAFEGVYDTATIVKWLRRFITRFFAQQFKRSCMPDGVKVTEISLSPRGAWAMPSEASARLWLEEIE